MWSSIKRLFIRIFSGPISGTDDASASGPGEAEEAKNVGPVRTEPTDRGTRMRAASFRSTLKGVISDFLAREGVRCPDTEDALLELVVALSHYTEEGSQLFPQVLICDNLHEALRLIQGSDAIKLGKGPKGLSTMSKALKLCAPLSKGGWLIYVVRTPTDFEYGVFRGSFSPTALEIGDALASLSEEAQDLTIILASHLTEKAVELTGVRSGRQLIYFSATPEDSPYPRMELNELVAECCTSVPIEMKDPVSSFLKGILTKALRECHGTLIIVLPEGNRD